MDREHDRLVSVIAERRIETFGTLVHRRPDHLTVSGIGNDEERILPGAVDDDVIENAARLVQQKRVLCAADFQTREGSGEAEVKKSAGLASPHFDFCHVAEVEQPDVVADLVVFGKIRAIANGHHPAREVSELGSSRLMDVVERDGLRHGNLSRQRHHHRGV